ncbi:MAG: ribosome maturation factor RimM, partial [Fusobacterium sp.]
LLNDLMDMEVVDMKNNETIGRVTDIFETAAHDILVVEDEKSEAMIPDIDEFVKKIDFDKRTIYVELIDGMREMKGKKYQQDDGIEDEE